MLMTMFGQQDGRLPDLSRATGLTGEQLAGTVAPSGILLPEHPADLEVPSCFDKSVEDLTGPERAAIGAGLWIHDGIDTVEQFMEAYGCSDTRKQILFTHAHPRGPEGSRR